MAKADTKTKMLADGLRYNSKVSGSPFTAATSFGAATMSCFLCGKHRPRSQLKSRRLLGKAQFVCSPGTYDQKHIDRIGKLKDCIAYGPGILDLAHQPDEWVGVDDMVSAAKVMARAAWSLLHGIR